MDQRGIGPFEGCGAWMPCTTLAEPGSATVWAAVAAGSDSPDSCTRTAARACGRSGVVGGIEVGHWSRRGHRPVMVRLVLCGLFAATATLLLLLPRPGPEVGAYVTLPVDHLTAVA